MGNQEDVNASEILKDLEKSVQASLENIPKPLQTIIQPIIKRSLQAWSSKLRSPKIALYGRTQSGKSSLINAIMGKRVAAVGIEKSTTLKPESYQYKRENWELEFVDSRGVGDSQDGQAINEAITYIVKEKIDILLFVVPTKEPGYVANDVDFLTKLQEEHYKAYGKQLATILVLNKIDEVPPIGEWNPPYDLRFNNENTSSKLSSVRQTKEANILACIRQRVEDYKVLTATYIPICSCWDDFTDRRHNIDELALLIYDLIPDEAKPGFGGATALPSVKRVAARSMTWGSAILAGSTCFVPIPGLDALSMVVIQASLVSLIARIASDNEDKNRVATNFISNLGVYGSGVAIAAFVQQAAKFIPGVGIIFGATAAATVAAITAAIGEAATKHFIEGISIEEAKSIFNQRNEEMREKFKEAFSHKGDPKLFSKDLHNLGEEFGVVNFD